MTKYYVKDKTEGTEIGEDTMELPLGSVASVDEEISVCIQFGGQCTFTSINLSRWSEISASEYMDLYAKLNICA